nr:unnamed protein product [Callosobruchus analis]
MLTGKMVENEPFSSSGSDYEPSRSSDSEARDEPSSSTSVRLGRKRFREPQKRKAAIRKEMRNSAGRMIRAAKKVRTTSPEEDLRDKHPPSNKTPEERRKFVHHHIKSFRAYESHYTRKHNPNRKYLNLINIRLMFTPYLEICTEKNESPVSKAMYRHIFHKDFNLYFHSPRKDTCTTCITLKMKIECEENPEAKVMPNRTSCLSKKS